MQFEIHDVKYYHNGLEIADPALYTIIDAYGDFAKGCKAVYTEVYSSPRIYKFYTSATSSWGLSIS